MAEYHTLHDILCPYNCICSRLSGWGAWLLPHYVPLASSAWEKISEHCVYILRAAQPLIKKINTIIANCSESVGMDFGYIEMNTSPNHFAFGFALWELQH